MAKRIIRRTGRETIKPLFGPENQITPPKRVSTEPRKIGKAVGKTIGKALGAAEFILPKEEFEKGMAKARERIAPHTKRVRPSRGA